MGYNPKRYPNHKNEALRGTNLIISFYQEKMRHEKANSAQWLERLDQATKAETLRLFDLVLADIDNNPYEEDGTVQNLPKPASKNISEHLFPELTEDETTFFRGLNADMIRRYMQRVSRLFEVRDRLDETGDRLSRDDEQFLLEELRSHILEMVYEEEGLLGLKDDTKEWKSKLIAHLSVLSAAVHALGGDLDNATRFYPDG